MTNHKLLSSVKVFSSSSGSGLQGCGLSHSHGVTLEQVGDDVFILILVTARARFRAAVIWGKDVNVSVTGLHDTPPQMF